MRKLIPYFIVSLFIFCQACQKEEQEIIVPIDDNTIPKNSELGVLIKNTVLHDGSYDDIVDHSNCFSINLPYSIQLNSELFTINSIEDYLQLSNGDDIKIQFPVTITFSNHLQENVTNQTTLDLFSANCIEDDEDIECIDFVYPFQISSFDSTKNQLATLNIAHDLMLFELMDDTNDNILSINYPINLISHTGQTHNTLHNTDLLNAIKTVGMECDENDN
ncbi:hypothetical protein [Aquimarina pacifica]|uniref:hypothetical protein n=1 Tax=Aquimarina pacifica TaxID=1296415 RepID=UPI001267FDA7|nr:hypothetical protein [Aquimarina pacifica]